MNARMLTGAVLGGFTLFVLGGLIYGLLLADFFAVAVSRDPPDFLLIALGELSFSLALAWMFTRTGAATPADGARQGAILGFLVVLAYGLTLAGTTTIGTLTLYLADAVVTAVRFAVAGAVIGWWYGRAQAPTTAD